MKGQSVQNCVANFVQKTFDILNNNQYAKIIHWSGNGKEFTIKDIEQFEETILPKHFRHRNINSFIRQLNMYGFHKSRKEPTKNIFSHSNFVKDKQELLQMVRRKIKVEEVTQIRFQQQIVEEEPIKIQEVAPQVYSQVPSITSLPVKSHTFLEKEISPLKSLISRSLLDMNPEMYLNMRDNFQVHYEIDKDHDDDDCLSIANEIQKERRAFNARTQGISIIKTSNFIEEFDF